MNLGLDHCAALARYDVSLSFRKEFIPKERFFSGWVINKNLEFDDLFLNKCKLIFKDMKYELENNQNVNFDPSFFWLKTKSAVINLAKKRENEIRILENKKGEVLRGFYSSVLKDIQNGQECFEELEKIKDEMKTFYDEKSKAKVDKMRVLEIEDVVYDIHKLQNQRKYENQKKINEIKIGNEVFTGTKDVVQAIENQMKKELEVFEDDEFLTSLPTLHESEFLSKLPKLILTEEERILLLESYK